MSTILDALKKSEQERRLGETPEIHSLARSGQPLPSEFPWVMVLLVLLALAVGVFAAQLIAQKQGLTDGAEFEVPALQRVAEASAAKKLEVVPAEQATSAVAADEDGSAMASMSRAPVPETLAAKQDRTHSDALIEQRRQQQVLAKARQQEATETSPLLALSDLPAHRRSQMPALTFSFHVWSSTPSQRTIIINGRRVREGEAIQADLRLLEITETGVILLQPPHRVFIPVLAEW